MAKKAAKITGKNLTRKISRIRREWKKQEEDRQKGIGRNKKGK